MKEVESDLKALRDQHPDDAQYNALAVDCLRKWVEKLIEELDGVYYALHDQSCQNQMLMLRPFVPDPSPQ